MPQETNLNVFPYYDDFNVDDNYFRVLFKPGYPVQARELTTLQSILQNQIEQFGTHTFKEGSVVIPGNIIYKNDVTSVIVEDSFKGLPSSIYFRDLVGVRIRGELSGVTAIVTDYLTIASGVSRNTLFVKYLAADNDTGSEILFFDGENLLVDEDVIIPDSNKLDDEDDETYITLFRGESFARTLPEFSYAVGSAVYLEEGIFFIRGHFVKVPTSILYLEPYSSTPSYRVGLKIFETTVNSYEDPDLNDNAQGFSNFAAPGADRFSIFATLSKVPIDSVDVDNFIELLQIRNGKLIGISKKPEYNVLSQEFARRTYDESGDYYVKPPIIVAQETLNDLKGNEGIFNKNQLTYDNNTPSESLGTYNISQLKAYVKGFEIETISSTFLDFEKPRTTKTLQNQSINYYTGPTFTVNRVYGSPIIGIDTSYYLSLRDSRVGSSQTTAPGTEIGVARVYDFALESGSYTTSNPNENQWDISLYDIQTYTNVKLNEPITLDVPTHVKGKSSGAVGFLRNSVSNSANLTIYDITGNFSLGEKLIFDGIENTRVINTIKSYGINDVKSLYGIVGTAYTFTADVIQSTSTLVGQVNISASSGGISTVTSSDIIFVGIASTGNLVSFSNPGLTTSVFAKIESVSTRTLTISGVTTVSGVCEGRLPSTSINPSDFKLLTTNLQASIDNTLYTELPTTYISNVDLTNSSLTIRRQFDVTISGNSTGLIDAGADQTFLPFDEERYVLIRSDGTTESLTSDKFVFTNGSKNLQISGLSGNGSAKLIATLRKINVKSKIKNKNRVKVIILNKSKYEGSGIGATTLDDGLSYGNYPYGTRVQDEDLCLLEPDVTNVYAVFESNDTNDPDLPSLVLTSLDGPTNKTGDLLVGEEFVGQRSNAVGIYAEKINDLKIGFVNLNANNFIEGETILFKESGIRAIISTTDAGDKDISSLYTFDPGQKTTFYDYSRVVREKNSKEPSRKLKVVYEYAGFSASDTGDLTTPNSYQQFDYCDIESIDGTKNSDILDIRPRVSSFTTAENVRSPFEFLARTFTSAGNSAPNVLASDESILLSYSYYLPRIDKILLNKTGVFQLKQGVPSENPQPPATGEDSIELATIYLPPYLCNINDTSIDLKQYKRYRMSDISKLEDRIENLEYYTSLTLLEVDTSNLVIPDVNGVNKFKSGIYVDNFSSTLSQNKSTIVKNSVDIINKELRPTHYTTSIDLILGTNSLVGIGTSANPLVDARTDDSLIGSGVKRTGQVITLDYQEVAYLRQPYSTRIVNVNPYAEDFFAGSIKLFPSSDNWVDQITYSATDIEIERSYVVSESQTVASGADQQTGVNPVVWDAHTTSWTGQSVGSNVSASNSSPTSNVTSSAQNIKKNTGNNNPKRRQRNKKGMVKKNPNKINKNQFKKKSTPINKKSIGPRFPKRG